MATVFVSGGTGFIGQAILKLLLEQGHSVRCLVRNRQILKQFSSSPNLHIFEGDVLSPETLTEPIRGCDAVIHLVGIIIEPKGKTFEDLHVLATRNVVHAAQTAGVRRYVQMSALGTRAGARSRYHQTKWAAEQIVKNSGLQWTIFRPSIVFGPKDQFVSLFLRQFSFLSGLLTCFLFPLFGGGTSTLQPIHVDQVARAFVGALTNESSALKIYDLCGPKPLPFKEILRAILKAKGVTAIIESFPGRAILRIVCLLLLMIFLGLGLLHPALLITSLIPAMTLVITRGWILFPLPSFVARGIGYVVENVLPNPFLTHDQAIMLEENNHGDPTPATQEFNLNLESFDQWIQNHVGSYDRP